MAFLVPQGIALDAKKVTTKLRVPKQELNEPKEKQCIYPKNEKEFRKVVDHLTFMGYDKKTSASKETFFVDNGSDENISSIEIEISYFNKEGKLIHKRTVDLEQEFPSKETRKVDIQSWDSQKSFHYINSVSSPKGSTPYTVKFRVLSFIYSSLSSIHEDQ